MQDEWDLLDYVAKTKIEAELLSPGPEMPTVEKAAEALGVSPGQVLKSVLFQTKAGECVLVVAAGKAKVNTKKLAKTTGLKGLRLAGPDVVLEVTGYPAGGTPPIGHQRKLRVIVDQQAAKLPYAYAGGGSTRVMMKLKPADIIHLNDAEVHDIIE